MGLKVKGYKSAIHNFTHSFMSIDYMKSGRLAINVLIDLNNLGKPTEFSIDFIKKNISPKESISDRSHQLMLDYLDWLPEHLKNHNCDYHLLEKLEIKMWADLNGAFSPPGMSNDLEVQINCQTKWKISGRNEIVLDISQAEVISKKNIQNGVPEIH